MTFQNNREYVFVNGRNGVTLSPQYQDNTLVVLGCTVRSHDYQQCVRLNHNGTDNNIIDWVLSLHAHNDGATEGPSSVSDDVVVPGPSRLNCSRNLVELVVITDDDDDDDEMN